MILRSISFWDLDLSQIQREFYCPIRSQQEKTNSGYKHNKQVSYGLNLTFRMLQHTSSEVTVTKYDKI